MAVIALENAVLNAGAGGRTGKGGDKHQAPISLSFV